MLCYLIYGLEVVDGDARVLPVIATDDPDDAKDSFDMLVKEATETIKKDSLRGIARKTEIYLGAYDNALCIGVEEIRHETIPQPQPTQKSVG